MIWLLFSFASEEDREKFERIYEKYKRLLFVRARQILGGDALAEDAVSEAFLRIYKNLHKIDDPESGRCASFAVTIVKNAALTLLAKQRRDRVAPMEEGGDQADPLDLEADMVSRLSSERILEIVDSLSEELRGVFLLKYAHGLSHREIGTALGITENNVTVRLHRARKKLCVLLAEEGYTDA